MALVEIRNLSESALPAERNRGLVWSYRGPFSGADGDFIQADNEEPLYLRNFTFITEVELLFDQATDSSNFYSLLDTSISTMRTVFERQSDGSLIAGFDGSISSAPEADFTAALVAGKNQIAFTYDSSGEIKQYVNGTLIETDSVPAGKVIERFSPRLGANNSGGATGGFIHHWGKAFSRVLSQEEIASYYKATPFDVLSDASLVVTTLASDHIDASNAKSLDGGNIAISGATKISDRRGYRSADRANYLKPATQPFDGSGAHTIVVGYAPDTFDALIGVEYMFGWLNGASFNGVYFGSTGSLAVFINGAPAGSSLGSVWKPQASEGGVNVFAMVFDAGNIDVYVNGHDIGYTGTYSGSISSDEFWLLNRWDQNFSSQGVLSFASAHNRALSELEVLDLTRALKASINQE
jgi:hypothetical protein